MVLKPIFTQTFLLYLSNFIYMLTSSPTQVFFTKVIYSRFDYWSSFSNTPTYHASISGAAKRKELNLSVLFINNQTSKNDPNFWIRYPLYDVGKICVCFRGRGGWTSDFFYKSSRHKINCNHKTFGFVNISKPVFYLLEFFKIS